MGAGKDAGGLGLEKRCIIERMIADLDELRERISAWPEEDQAAALFALEDELEDRTLELFLRRVITDERIPFDVVALEPMKVWGALRNAKGNGPAMVAGGGRPAGTPEATSKLGETRYRRAKEFKKISGGRTPPKSEPKKRRKEA